MVVDLLRRLSRDTEREYDRESDRIRVLEAEVWALRRELARLRGLAPTGTPSDGTQRTGDDEGG